jgi:hypothetical protein
MEVAAYCVDSVLEIRRFLSGELGKLDGKSEFAASLRAMRAAYRKFLDRVGIDGREMVRYANHHGHWASWTFYSALGEMRGTFGVHLAKIAAEFKLDIEDRLASILPANAEADSGGRSAVLLAEDSRLADVRTGAASQRVNFRHSTPGRVHVRKLSVSLVNSR